jgi:hypothetical protein
LGRLFIGNSHKPVIPAKVGAIWCKFKEEIKMSLELKQTIKELYVKLDQLKEYL